MKRFTLVSTIFNETDSLADTICDIKNQSVVPDEIIITDAGSTDGTFQQLISWSATSKIPIKILKIAGCNIAEGRNAAIEAASNNLIASTDFGCRFHSNWLESIIKPFDDEAIRVVGGNFTIKEEEVKTLPAKADYILSNSYENILNEHFPVSSRSIAFYKDVWLEVGKYPEWLTLAADDTVFWRKIKQKPIPYYLCPESYVFWQRHKSFSAYSAEAYRYGRGDGEGSINFTNFLSHCIETGFRYSFYLNLLLLPVSLTYLPILPLVLFLPQLFGLRSFKNALKNWLRLRSSKYNFIVLAASLFMIECLRYNYIKGYIKGRLSRTSRQSKNAAKLKIS